MNAFQLLLPPADLRVVAYSNQYFCSQRTYRRKPSSDSTTYTVLTISLRLADSSWLAFPHCSWTLSHADWSLLLSSVDSQLPLSVTNWLLSSFVQLPTHIPLPTSGHIEDLGLRPLFGFTPKQTKGSSAWRTTYIMSHSNNIGRRQAFHPVSSDSFQSSMNSYILCCHKVNTFHHFLQFILKFTFSLDL